MLSILGDMAAYLPLTASNGRDWLDITEDWVSRTMPFWTDYDVQRISRNLKDKGIIVLASAPYVESRRLTLAFDEADQTRSASSPVNPSPAYSLPINPAINAGATLIAPNWQPDQELLRQIAQYNIPAEFVRQQVPEFVTYWRERGETNHSWGAKFLKDLLHKWRNYETELARQKRKVSEQQVRERDTEFLNRDLETAMHNQWRPSRDALEVLVKHASISLAFVEDSIPEFVVYWQERGDVGRTWNSKFIQHVKRQWMRYNSALEHDTEPKRIPDNWQPSKDVFDVLKLANIDLKFAQQQVAEFLLYWRDSNQLLASWNTKFLQHVKFHWAKQHALTTVNSQQVNPHARQQFNNPTGRTRDSSLTEQLNDRSWAS